VENTGLYRGQCAELCGRDHGFMPIVVDVRSKADFESWLHTQQALQRPADAASAAALPDVAPASAASAVAGNATSKTG